MEISTTKDFAENFQKVFFRDVRPKLALYELHRRNIIERNKKHRKNMFVWCAGIVINGVAIIIPAHQTNIGKICLFGVQELLLLLH